MLLSDRRDVVLCESLCRVFVFTDEGVQKPQKSREVLGQVVVHRVPQSCRSLCFSLTAGRQVCYAFEVTKDSLGAIELCTRLLGRPSRLERTKKNAV
jgi:hypothetical protein